MTFTFEAEGVTVPSSPDGRSGFLTDVILELGLASPEAVADAVELSRIEGGVAEEILVEQGSITGEQLAIALAERNGLPYVDLLKFEVEEGAARLIPSETARRYRAMPIAFDPDGALVVAIADPLDALAVSDIGVITKSETKVVVATDAGIQGILDTLPDSEIATTLSARGMDGIGAARTAEADGWSLTSSISSPGTGEDSPVAGHPAAQDAVPEPSFPQAQAPAAPGPSPDLESRIDALVSAALEKRLTEAAAPAADPRLERAQEELALTRAELDQARVDAARSREEAMQAQAELQALAARLEQLENRAQQPQSF